MFSKFAENYIKGLWDTPMISADIPALLSRRGYLDCKSTLKTCTTGQQRHRALGRVNLVLSKSVVVLMLF